jgi:hypothetical protein
MKVLGGHGTKIPLGVGIGEQGPGRWVSHVEQVPWKADLEQAGLPIEVPVGQAQNGLGGVQQPAPVVSPSWEEGTVPPEARPVGDNEERIESPVVAIPGDHRPSGEPSFVVTGTGR